MSEERLLKVAEVAVTVDSSVQTINGWYKWKKENPDHELAKLLPDYIVKGGKRTRYWNQSDIWQILQFKKSIPQGCKGILGSVTQRYTASYKKKQAEKEKNS